MRYILITIFLLSLFGCKREYKKTIESFQNGKTKAECVYPDKNDTTCFTIYEYFPNGKISFKGIVEKGKFVGAKLNYYDNGNLREVDSIINPCELEFCCCDGKVLRYFRNGKLHQTFENRNGVANGLMTYYLNDSSGILDVTCNYKEGRKNGEAISYFRSEKIYSIKTFNNDTLVGYIYYFKENGDTSKYFYHFKGKQDFPAKKWLANGQILFVKYADSTYNKAIFLWTDKSGKEINRQIIIHDKKGNFILPD